MLSALDKARSALVQAEARLEAAQAAGAPLRERLYRARKVCALELQLQTLEREARKGWRMPA